MIIDLQQVSKRYTNQWILKNVTYTFESGNKYAIRGSNGSGKSTLLKILSGFLSPSKGNISYAEGGKTLSKSTIYKSVSYAAPYLGSPEKLSVQEAVTLHFRFKNIINGQAESWFYDQMNLPVNKSARLNELSSGQQQRLHLAMAILSDTDILLLDKPGSYLDESANAWLQNLIANNAHNRLVIVASNDDGDLKHCDHSILVSDYH
jgi:ABC-type multidrug transport system ATPase subunit